MKKKPGKKYNTKKKEKSLKIKGNKNKKKETQGTNPDGDILYIRADGSKKALDTCVEGENKNKINDNKAPAGLSNDKKEIK